MAKKPAAAKAAGTKTATGKGHQFHDPSPEGLEAAQASAAGAEFVWHFGRVTGLGSYDFDDGRGVTIAWDEGGTSSHAGGLAEAQWDVLKMAFLVGGRVAVLSDVEGDGWMYDYRYLEAVR
jgi:hypothetical protein